MLDRESGLALWSAIVSRPVIVERLVVQPGLVPPGQYRITMLVRDRVLGLTSRAVAVDVELR